MNLSKAQVNSEDKYAKCGAWRTQQQYDIEASHMRDAHALYNQRDPRMYYMDWIWDRLVWVKPIRLHSHARVFSALSQSGSRYWHSQSLWLSIDRPARHYRVTPWARSEACWELEGMAFILNIHIGHSTV
ncbi:hypothetical protein DPX16_19951 [Anabarilius grahami]|uniref:Uncharacterized protein n=1 Tax=Anabarilius grahami TaxID=495550 RepID=A0A3N0YGL5_ANAGA|nr:hypothetical protein DPX16_19951 [Anabarilius grahami]